MNKLEKAKNYVKEHKAEIGVSVAYGITIGLFGLGCFELGIRTGNNNMLKAFEKVINDAETSKGLPPLNLKAFGNMFKGYYVENIS